MIAMVTVLLALALAQAPQCNPEAAALMKAATEHAAAFDLEGAAQRLRAAVMSGCADAVLPSIYLRGWIAARDAYRFGGSLESLATVSRSIGMLQDTLGKSGPPQIAALVLQAAAAAAQSERDELGLVIEYAVQLEDRNLAAKLPGLPMITAHEAAGDLWLQVHRYDDARRAYEKAAQRLGMTPRITLGLARLAARIDALSTACAQYRTFVASWKTTGSEPSELAEARAFLSNPACQPSATPRP
jgi:tetratricopeptide (TPR) repeat protein